MSKHSILSPSSAGVWGKLGGCPGSVAMKLSTPYVERDTSAADEGTLAHAVAEQLVESYRRAGTLPTVKPGATFKGQLITDEMFESADLYARDIQKIMRETSVFGGIDIGIEKSVSCGAIHPECFGTVDFFLYARNDNRVYIYDFKYGFTPVEVEQNWQLMCYASGIMDLLKIDGFKDQQTTIVFKIVQPRAYHKDGSIRDWRVKASDLRSYINIMKDNAVEALSENPRTHTGEHCRYCNARYVCKASVNTGMSIYESTRDVMPELLDAAGLGLQLSLVSRAKKQLEYIETGLEEVIKSRIKSGGNIPGYSIEPALGRETWSQEPETVFKMGEFFGLDFRNKNPITPKQAIDLGADPETIRTMSTTPQRGFKLAKTDESKINRIFK